MENHTIGPLPAAVIEQYQAEIAELKKENLRLRHSEELLLEERNKISGIIKKTLGFVFLLSPDYGIHFLGDSLQQQFGGAPSSCRCYEILNHLSSPCDHCPAMKVFTTRQMISWEETLPDGHTYKVSGYPYSLGKNNLVLLVGMDISDQKIVENSLRLNEQKYKVLLKTIPDTILIVDKDYFIISFQSGSHFHTNTQSERVVGRNLKDLIPRIPADIFARLVREVLETRKQLFYEYEISRLDRFEEARFTWCNQNEVMIIIRDISERKHTEIKLSKNEKSLKHGQRIAHLGTWEYNVQTNTFASSEESYRIFGIPEKVYSVERLVKVIHPDDLSRFLETFWNSEKRSSSGGIDFRIVQPDKTIRIVHGEGNFTYDVSGKPVSIFGTVQDITERKQIEDALRESETRFRILADTTSGAILIYQDEIYVYANPAATVLTGFSLEEILVQKYWEIVHPDYRDLVISRATSRIQGKNVLSKYSVKLLHKSGESRWAEINVGITTYNGKPALIVTAFDITDHISAEERALASLKEKEILLKEVHHRVKNNLQIISSLLSLQSVALGDKEAASAFINSQHRIRSMALIHEMLYQSEDFSRISLSSYIQKLAYNLLRSYNVDTSKIRLNIEADQAFLDIEHAIPCGLILNELMTNSIKYAFVNKQEGNISIKLQKNVVTGKYVLTIGDDGDGLPAGIDLGNLKTLGMELVATLVGQLDGTIELDREAGTTFRITF